jgi:hypothetical protein
VEVLSIMDTKSYDALQRLITEGSKILDDTSDKEGPIKTDKDTVTLDFLDDNGRLRTTLTKEEEKVIEELFQNEIITDGMSDLNEELDAIDFQESFFSTRSVQKKSKKDLGIDFLFEDDGLRQDIQQHRLAIAQDEEEMAQQKAQDIQNGDEGSLSIDEAEFNLFDEEDEVEDESCKQPGRKIRSAGKGRGLGRGAGKGPIGKPVKEEEDEEIDESFSLFDEEKEKPVEDEDEMEESFRLFEDEDEVDIKVKHPGILAVPEGKKVDQLPFSHFEALVKKHGYDSIAKALTNLEVWNKNRDPKLARWAKSTRERLEAKYGAKEESFRLFEDLGDDNDDNMDQAFFIESDLDPDKEDEDKHDEGTTDEKELDDEEEGDLDTDKDDEDRHEEGTEDEDELDDEEKGDLDTDEDDEDKEGEGTTDEKELEDEEDEDKDKGFKESLLFEDDEEDEDDEGSSRDERALADEDEEKYEEDEEDDIGEINELIKKIEDDINDKDALKKDIRNLKKTVNDLETTQSEEVEDDDERVHIEEDFDFDI